MKFRVGFVSNSSSSSFVLDKADMTNDQIKQFQVLIYKASEDGETFIFESERHFHGNLSMHDEEIPRFLAKHNLKADICM